MSKWDAVIKGAQNAKSAAQGTGLGTPVTAPSRATISLAEAVENAATLSREQEKVIVELRDRLSALETKK